ncbi:UNVERIFIED_ORG: glycosyltransferase [Bacillus sp. AZ43]
MGITIIAVADTRAAAVDASLQALVHAVAEAEAADGSVEIVVVDSSGRPDVATFLLAVDGALILRAPGADRSAALRAGLEAATGDVVWFGGTDSCPVPPAVITMAAAVRRDGGVVVAAPEDPAPHAAAPAALLRRAWADDAPDGTGHDPVPALLRWAASAGVPVTAVTGAGTVRDRVRRPHARWRGVTKGPATYTGLGALAETYSPQNSVELGAYCSVADEVRLLVPGSRLFDETGEEFQLSLRGMHRPETATTFPIGILVPDEPFDELPPGTTGERQVIGDDVWIGYGATVLGNVTVGTGSIVGARALVTADVPPYSVVAGVPARVIRKRFEDDAVERLLRIAWWDWPQAVVEGAYQWFRRPVTEFLDHYDPGSLVPPSG